VIDVHAQLLGDLVLQHGADFGIEIGVLVMKHRGGDQDIGACGTEALRSKPEGKYWHLNEARVPRPA
jgi:hypothetical protein